MSKIDSDLETELLRLLLAFEGIPPPGGKKEFDALIAFLFELSRRGWSRRQLYEFLSLEAYKLESKLPAESHDALANCADGLTGFSSGGFIPLPGDPKAPLELYEYFYEGKWIKEARLDLSDSDRSKIVNLDDLLRNNQNEDRR